MAEVKSRPILFSGAMVRAILDRSKTQTRRVVTAQNSHAFWKGSRSHIGAPVAKLGFDPNECHLGIDPHDGLEKLLVQLDISGQGFDCFTNLEGSIWEPGQTLWVRETWGTFEPFGKPVAKDKSKLVYRADGGVFVPDCGWKPSIFMPRWASRIELEIVSVRVERLNEIRCDDAFAEGVPCASWAEHDWDDDGFPTPIEKRHRQAIEEYKELWESINGKGSWALNPWVWVVEFKRVES